MINSGKLLEKPSLKVSRLVVVWIIALAVVGLGVATYLTVEHLRGELPICTILEGCERVLTSKFASVGPVPTAVFGVGYYLSVIALCVLYIFSDNPMAMRLIGFLGFVGFLVSLVLVYVQIWVIEAVCIYCMTSAVVCTLLFVTDIAIWMRYLMVSKSGDGSVVGESF